MIAAIYGIAIALLLLSGSPASGACAWVVWAQELPGLGPRAMQEQPRSRPPLPVQTYETRAQCTARLAEMHAEFVAINAKGGVWRLHLNDGGALSARGDLFGHTWTCLPDTIDPRGTERRQ